MKVLAVTGGGQGIGRAIARSFANAGYAVSIADTDAAAGREVVRMIEAAGGAALFLRTDVGVPAQIDRWECGLDRNARLAVHAAGEEARAPPARPGAASGEPRRAA